MKQFINWLKSRFSRFFTNYEFRLKVATAAMLTVNNFKRAIESKEAVTVVKITPTQIDDAFHPILINVTDRVAFHVAVAHKLISNSDSPENALQAIADHIASLNPEAGATYWPRLTAELTKAMLEAYADKKITLAECFSLGQIAFQLYKEIKG